MLQHKIWKELDNILWMLWLLRISDNLFVVKLPSPLNGDLARGRNRSLGICFSFDPDSSFSFGNQSVIIDLTV